MKYLSLSRYPVMLLLTVMPFFGFAENQPPPQIPPPGTMNIEPNMPDDGVMKEKPRLEDLGNGKYRIGEILLDKARGRFTLPGKMLPYEESKPLEFIAVTRRGHKAYESLLELEANAFEFNLACILIGLDGKNGRPAKYHFDPEPMQGDQVAILVAREVDGKRQEVDPLAWLKSNEEITVPAIWNYIGSQFIDGDRYLAQMDGTLIGLVHDPASIIEHHSGLGLGHWGMLTVDQTRAPSAGTDIELTVIRLPAKSVDNSDPK